MIHRHVLYAPLPCHRGPLKLFLIIFIFPFLLLVTALIKYIALKFTLEECEEEAWDQFVHCLDTENKVRKLKKTIDRHYQYDTSRKKYEEFLKLWIREKEKSINKVSIFFKYCNKISPKDISLNISLNIFHKSPHP